MAKPRNFVTELKESAKQARQMYEAPEDFSGLLSANTATHTYLFQYLEGFLAGVLVFPNEELADFVGWANKLVTPEVGE